MIILFDGYEILINDLGYTVVKNNGLKLFEEKDKETGEVKKVEKTSYTTLGYYTTLETSLNGARKEMVKQKLKDDSFKLDEALNVVRELNKKFDELITK